MATSGDDFQATRTLVETLSPFDPKDQQRIIRWACEKLGVAVPVQGAPPPSGQTPPPLPGPQEPRFVAPGSQPDIKSFVTAKNPATDMQFAATVAYFFAFEAPEAEQKKSITAADLMDACRKVGRGRLQNPGQTLRNACHNGLLDKGEDRGAYKINTVGENLVAVTLPGGPADQPKRTIRKTKSGKKVVPKRAKGREKRKKPSTTKRSPK